MEERTGALESLLFIAGDEGMTLEEMAVLLEMTPLEAHNLVLALQKSYEEKEGSGLTVIETRSRYQLATKRRYSELIKKYAVSPFISHLSQAALETLAIIAYKQPITRIEIDEIRGVQSANMLQRLVLRGLVKDLGRAEKPGRPIIYGTSDYFMNYFGLKDLEDLPNAEGLFDITDDEMFDLFEQEDFPMNEEE